MGSTKRGAPNPRRVRTPFLWNSFLRRGRWSPASRGPVPGREALPRGGERPPPLTCWWLRGSLGCAKPQPAEEHPEIAGHLPVPLRVLLHPRLLGEFPGAGPSCSATLHRALHETEAARGGREMLNQLKNRPTLRLLTSRPYQNTEKDTEGHFLPMQGSSLETPAKLNHPCPMKPEVCLKLEGALKYSEKQISTNLCVTSNERDRGLSRRRPSSGGGRCRLCPLCTDAL